MPQLTPTINAPLFLAPAQPITGKVAVWSKSPLFDFEHGEFYLNGAGQVIMGNELQSSVQLLRKALITARNKWRRVYDNRFGSDIPPMLGKNYAESVKVTLAIKYTRDAIEFYSFVRELRNIQAVVLNDAVTVTLTVLLADGQKIQLQTIWTMR